MKLNVVMIDTFRTYIAVAYENDHLPYGRRLVQIELTPEQVEKLRPRELGSAQGKPFFEEIGQVWLEKDEPTGGAQ